MLGEGGDCIPCHGAISRYFNAFMYDNDKRSRNGKSFLQPYTAFVTR